jgi:hypothetical protein
MAEKAKYQVHLMTAAFAAGALGGGGLGLTAEQIGLLGDAVAGIEDTRREPVMTTAPRATFAALTNLQTAGQVCDLAEAQLGLDDGDCTISHVEGWCVDLLDRDGNELQPVNVRAVVRRDGTWSDGPPVE